MAGQLQAGSERGDGNRGASQDETEAEQSSLDPLNQLSRYETAISRGAQRAIQELRHLQAARDKIVLEHQVVIDVNEASRGKA